ncbi:CsiV family protein [Glaciecola sp. SC05]|uniref:CsiV family protein n=1 Tax=Glaciecola sp. SC05 TaxID=1987355 RepID=UPI0035288E03
MAEFSTRHLLKSSILFVTVALSCVPSTFAQESDSDWWFDIEFIAFKRDLLPGHPEDFAQTDYVFSDDSPFDLFTIDLFKRTNPTFRLANALPDCDPNKRSVTLADLTISSFDVEGLLQEFERDRQALTETLSGQDTSVDNVLFDISHLQFVEQQQYWLTQEPPHLPVLTCTSELAYDDFDQVPQQFFANSPYLIGHHSVLANEQLPLSEYAKRVFAQRDITPIIYTAWRQPVIFGEDNASFYRIFAGKRLDPSAKVKDDTLENTEADAVLKTPIDDTSTEDLPETARMAFVLKQLNLIESALKSEQDVTWEVPDDAADKEQTDTAEITAQWELDGLFKVYLDYVNRVPYLHVDSEFKHARLDLDASGTPILNSYPSKQRRRIISKQIHYFDHPAFGITVRLERYQPPVDSAQNVGNQQN